VAWGARTRYPFGSMRQVGGIACPEHPAAQTCGGIGRTPQDHRGRARPWVRHLTSSAIISLSLTVALIPACIDSKCFVDRDCAGGNVCQPLTGSCVAPQCQSNQQCPAGRVCEQHRCVVGCVDDNACAKGLKCVNSRCRVWQEQCQCPLAPIFCPTDINPMSATFGAQVCAAGGSGGGMMLLFGSVLCPHCRALFTALQGVESRLQQDGLQPTLIFVQIKSVQPSADMISALMTDDRAPIFQDTDDMDIWGAYGVDWYYAVILDTHDCIAARFGPLESYTVQGETGDIIERSWRSAMDPACALRPVPGADAAVAAGSSGS
jgi:hypothetical protein